MRDINIQELQQQIIGNSITPEALQATLDIMNIEQKLALLKNKIVIYAYDGYYPGVLLEAVCIFSNAQQYTEQLFSIELPSIEYWFDIFNDSHHPLLDINRFAFQGFYRTADEIKSILDKLKFILSKFKQFSPEQQKQLLIREGVNFIAHWIQLNNPYCKDNNCSKILKMIFESFHPIVRSDLANAMGADDKPPLYGAMINNYPKTVALLKEYGARDLDETEKTFIEHHNAIRHFIKFNRDSHTRLSDFLPNDYLYPHVNAIARLSTTYLYQLLSDDQLELINFLVMWSSKRRVFVSNTELSEVSESPELLDFLFKRMALLSFDQVSAILHQPHDDHYSVLGAICHDEKRREHSILSLLYTRLWLSNEQAIRLFFAPLHTVWGSDYSVFERLIDDKNHKAITFLLQRLGAQNLKRQLLFRADTNVDNCLHRALGYDRPGTEDRNDRIATLRTLIGDLSLTEADMRHLIFAVNQKGDNPVMSACAFDNTEVLRIMLNASGMSDDDRMRCLTQRNQEGQNAMHIALAHEQFTLATVLHREFRLAIPENMRITVLGSAERNLNPSQSTHTASVHQSISDSAAKLAQRYQAENGDAALEAMRAWLATLPIVRHDVVAAFDAYHRIIDTTEGDYTDQTSTVSLRYALALIWIGAHDPHAQQEIALTPEILSDRKNRILQHLYEAERGGNLDAAGVDHNPDSRNYPICPPGKFNKIIQTLSGNHDDVTSVYITSAIATLKASRLPKKHFLALPEADQRALAGEWKVDHGISDVLWDRIKEGVKDELFAEFSGFVAQDILQGIADNMMLLNPPDEVVTFAEAVQRERAAVATAVNQRFFSQAASADGSVAAVSMAREKSHNM